MTLYLQTNEPFDIAPVNTGTLTTSGWPDSYVLSGVQDRSACQLLAGQDLGDGKSQFDIWNRALRLIG
ncbi:MAG TPA: hypothetical protein DCQ06_01895 [Myxococcales bacterium]|nr:hypothetical protein [Myxococcales bacterium]HAN30327.1 hypothetical protein [Myxococcales bacterium]